MQPAAAVAAGGVAQRDGSADDAAIPAAEVPHLVDLWGGVADRRTGRPWEHDTIAVVFSVTKGVAATCGHMLTERGLLDLDAPVTDYWPEYGAEGKEGTTVRQVMSHRTGLQVVDGPVTEDDVADHGVMAARLAAQAPLFPPGSAHAYQAVTFSWTFGELFRRAAGEPVGAYLAREVAALRGEWDRAARVEVRSLGAWGEEPSSPESCDRCASRGLAPRCACRRWPPRRVLRWARTFRPQALLLLRSRRHPPDSEPAGWRTAPGRHRTRFLRSAALRHLRRT